jgi:hypothetical protein
MSISSLNTSAQTGLVPQTLLGYSSNGVSALEINPTSITIAGDLNTPTPIYVVISASTGLTTTLATGLDVNCDFNMNSNNITNLDTLSSAIGGDLTLSASNQVILNSIDNVDINAGENILVSTNTTTGTIQFISPTPTYFNLTTPNMADGVISVAEINRNTGDITINSQDYNLFLQSTTGMSLNVNNGALLLTTSGAGIGLTTDQDINLDSITDINITSSTGKINANSDIVMKDANEPTWNTELSTGGLSFNLPIGSDTNSVIIDAEGSSTIVCQIANVVSTNSTTINPYQIQFNGGGINTTLTPSDITTNDNFSISNATGFTNSISLNTTTGDTTIASAFGSVNITSGNGDAGTSDISLYAVEGDIVLNTGSGYEVSSNAPITSSVGYTGKVYHTDQPTTALTYYLTFVQSGGISGYYDPAFDSATLTYNPSTNLLSVAGLQLSGATITGTFSAGILSLGCNEASSRQFQIAMTANITGLTLSNRRTNGVYTCSLYNVSGSTWTISNVLTGTALNKTDYASPISVANGEFAILTARTLLTNGTAFNYVSVVKFA